MPHYSPRLDPPAPILEIQVENPFQKELRRTASAVLDIGSDITAIPQFLLRALKLKDSSKVSMTGIDGMTLQHNAYLVNLTVEGFPFERLEVIDWRGDEVLLGRDVLNEFEITLDGKNRQFEMRDP